MAQHEKVLPRNASTKTKREALAKDAAARAEHEAYVAAYLGRYFQQSWSRPRPLRSMEAIVELAVAGLDHAVPSRALCVAICRAAGIRTR